ncbi:MAG: ClpXP protease specificity-enhancing factor [Burkholderiaceae bacterium]
MSVSALTPSPISTRPYLLRALYEWCTDNGYTPYIAAYVDETVQVPREHVKNNEIVLNISMDATSSLKLGNEFVEFKARFSGAARQIMVPIDRVIAIYARENGQGMAFPLSPGLNATATTVEPAPVPLAVAPKMQTVPKRAATKTGEIASNQSSETATTPAKLVQLVKASSDTTEGNDGAPPPIPPSPSGVRPSLKRVK